MKKVYPMIICLVVACLLFGVFGYGNAAEKLQWTYPVLLIPGQYSRDAQDWFASEVYKQSKGRLQIFNHQYKDVGLTGFECLTTVKNGAYPLIEIVSGYAAGEIPALALYSIPYAITNPKEGITVLGATLSIRQRELDKFNAADIPLYQIGPPLTLFSTKPVRKLADLKGMKLRAPGRIIASYAKALGATPVTTPLAESYTALQRGTVDAALTAPHSAFALGWHEVAKYVTLFTTPLVSFTVVNKDSWKTLPKDIQDMILQTARETTEKITAGSLAEIAGTADSIRAKGLEYIELPPAEEVKRRGIAMGLWDQWAKKCGPAGPEFLKEIKKATGR